MIDIVVDIETVGKRPGCIVLEIGACALDPRSGGEIAANFSLRLDDVYARVPPDMEDYGGTVDWWGDPERMGVYLALVRRAGTYEPLPPEKCRSTERGLRAFCAWIAGAARGERLDGPGVRVWGNGPQFDLVILRDAMEREGVRCPWHYRQERCVRTALDVAGCGRGEVPWTEAGPRHRALNDARHEAKKLWESGAIRKISNNQYSMSNAQLDIGHSSEART